MMNLEVLNDKEEILHKNSINDFNTNNILSENADKKINEFEANINQYKSQEKILHLERGSKVCKKKCIILLVCLIITVALNVIGGSEKKLLWLVFVPGVLNFMLCLIFIPIFGYQAAIYSTIIAYWSQLMIPFFVKYYRDNVKIWMGNLIKILWILMILLTGLILGQFCASADLWLKIVLTLLIVFSFLIVYMQKRLYEIV